MFPWIPAKGSLWLGGRDPWGRLFPNSCLHRLALIQIYHGPKFHLLAPSRPVLGPLAVVKGQKKVTDIP